MTVKLRSVITASRMMRGAVASGMTLAVLTAVAPSVPPAAAATLPEAISAHLLPTVQTNGIVYSITTVGNVVYAAGNFTKARPYGTAAGDASEVTRNNLLAFDLTTGALLPFAPVITTPSYTSTTNPGPFCDSLGTNTWQCDAVFRVVASPDQKKIYISGDFTRIDGQVRNRIAAFDVATGTLDATFHPSPSSRVRGLAVSSSAVYFAGDFTSVTPSSGTAVTRTRVASTDLSGNLLKFAPSADREVWAAELSSDGTRLLLGGQFDYINSTQIHGLASVYTGTATGTTAGANAPWASTGLIPGAVGATTNRSWVTDFSVRGDNVYIAADGEGSGIFDGRIAAKVSTGALIWIDYCLGATQSITELNGVVYGASHSHNCGPLGTFPERVPKYYMRLPVETAAATTTYGPGANAGKPAPTMLPIWSQIDGGPDTSYFKNGPWAVDASGDYLVVGGEFLTVNGENQQSLARFELRSKAPASAPPQTPFLAPVARALRPGQIRVSWRATFDLDDPNLTYEVYRNSDTTPIATLTQTSTFYDLPEMSFTDTVPVGTTNTYRIKASDGNGNKISTKSSASATATDTSALGRYDDALIRDGAYRVFTFNSAAGATTEPDAVGTGSATVTGVTFGQSPAGTSGGTSATFGGTPSSYAVADNARIVPGSMAEELWFKSTSKYGGELIGFGNRPTAGSDSVDRLIYLSTDGHLLFGVYNTAVHVLSTAKGGYNDGKWHHVVGNLSPAGMSFFVDGSMVAASTAVTTSYYYEGYLHFGGDNITTSWPSKPGSSYAAATIDDVALYPRPLGTSQIADHYARRANRAPSTSFTAACASNSCSFDGTASQDPDGWIGSYSWDFGDGTTATGATPNHAYADSGSHTVVLTVTDNEGTTSSSSRAVTS